MKSKFSMKEVQFHSLIQCQLRYLSQTLFATVFIVLLLMFCVPTSIAGVIEFNTTGGTTATNGLHFYIEDTTHMQVRRLNNTGQVYSPTVIPPSTSLDNGVFIRANGLVYGPSHTVSTFNPSGGMFNTFSITATSPANPSASGVQQTVTNNFGITAGPQVSVVWKYTTPLDFLTADVTITIPAGYAVSAANPVRYLHAFDTFLGGADQGCGIKFSDSSGNLVVGTYQPATAGTCPSSTSLPPGASIVESFRERSGKTFSSYCANTWSTFWSGSSCSVLQSAALSNTITTTYIDTGIGVAFDFTAAGTYTFSYDFVIGSTVVPAYDHIELVHDGSASLCPENVKVLACTSATVPCPALSIVNSGTITGVLTVTPPIPTVTVTPATFSIGPSVYSPIVVLQGSGAGTYTLGATGISGTPPLNGTKCWNGTSASCTLTITNTSCATNFECMETASVVPTYNNLTSSPGLRNPLYTKLVGTPFSVDIVALQASGAISPTYNGTVTVELFDDTTTQVCTAYSSPIIAGQTLTFASTDNGRKTITTPINLAKAYRKLRCRATQTVPTAVSGCSSDDFTVRPLNITSVSSTDATADSTGASVVNSPVIKAGLGFNLTANTNTVGYDDKPKIDSSKLEWLTSPAGGQLPAPPPPTNTGTGTGTTTLAGLFTNLATPTTGNGAFGNAFTYDDVGYFRFQALGVYDDSFTTYSNDATNSDCVANSASNSLSIALPSDPPLTAGKYGCRFANVAVTPYFGRFIPHHFTLATLVAPSVSIKTGCLAGGFTYMDQAFELNANIEARSLSGNLTLNYSSGFGKGSVTPQLKNASSAINLSSRLSGIPAPGWTGGIYAFAGTNFNFSRLATADGPYDSLAIGLSATDETGAVLLFDRDMDASTSSCGADSAGTSSGTCTAKTIATTKMRHGRLKLGNAHGSERLDLPIPLRLEYWSGTTLGWAINTLDTCSNFVASNFSFVFPAGTAAKPNNLAACETYLPSVGGVAPKQSLVLKAPGTGNNGWTDMTLKLATPSGNQCVALGAAGAAAVSPSPARIWLQYHWSGAGATLQNPSARATFGIYKNANEFIYLREIH